MIKIEFGKEADRLSYISGIAMGQRLAVEMGGPSLEEMIDRMIPGLLSLVTTILDNPQAAIDLGGEGVEAELRDVAKELLRDAMAIS